MNPYLYKACVKRVVDGDTIDVWLDLGFDMWSLQRLRLARINAPESRGEERVEGKAATVWLKEKLPEETEIFIQTDKRGKYGRYVAEIFLMDEDQAHNINDMLVEAGHAVYKEY